MENFGSVAADCRAFKGYWDTDMSTVTRLSPKVLFTGFAAGCEAAALALIASGGRACVGRERPSGPRLIKKQIPPCLFREKAV